MRVTLSILTAVAFLALFSGQAHADISPGLYVGGGFGQADLTARVSASDVSGVVQYNGEFASHRSAFQVVVGARPIALVGSEIAYVDFGRPDGTVFGQQASASMRGGAVFAMGYLPLPLVEVYGKAGLARLQSHVGGFTPPTPIGFRFYYIDRTDTGLAAGAGAQIKLGSMAVRAEYERFNAAGEHPSLVSILVTWTVL